MERKWIVGGAILVMALAGCSVEVKEERGSSESPVSDATMMQRTWDGMDAETKANMCAGWVEDKDKALNIMYASAGNNPMPAESLVRAFFDQKCL